MIRILVADDHSIVREGIRQVMALAADVHVAGEARDGWEVAARLGAESYDVLITDISMPGPHGVELVHRVRQDYPRLAILVLSMHGESQVASRALKAGANGYLTKDSEPAELIAAVRKVARGGRYISAEMAEKLVFESCIAADRPAHELLSNRELEVLELLARGQGVNQIAQGLNVSAKTVSTHKARLMEKLGLETNADIVRYALQHGFAE